MDPMPTGTSADAGKTRASATVARLYDERTYSVQYVVSDPATSRCAIIDPVLDYDEKSGSTATRSTDALLDHVRARGLAVGWILETHPHADHVSAAGYLKKVTGAATGARIRDVQRLWMTIYGFAEDFPADGSQ